MSSSNGGNASVVTFPSPKAIFSRRLYALSTSSFTITRSCTPGCLAYAISLRAIANRLATDSSDSVPRPLNRDLRDVRDGGDMKT